MSHREPGKGFPPISSDGKRKRDLEKEGGGGRKEKEWEGGPGWRLAEFAEKGRSRVEKDKKEKQKSLQPWRKAALGGEGPRCSRQVSGLSWFGCWSLFYGKEAQCCHWVFTRAERAEPWGAVPEPQAPGPGGLAWVSQLCCPHLEILTPFQTRGLILISSPASHVKERVLVTFAEDVLLERQEQEGSGPAPWLRPVC